MKYNILLTAMMMAALVFGAAGNEAYAQNKKNKDLEDEIKHLRDSLKSLTKQIEDLEEENIKYRSDQSLTDPYSYTGTTSSFSTQLTEDEYTVEVTDSLLDLWYAHQMAKNAEEEVYDMNTVRFASNVPDEVYIERIKKMNSFIQVPYNDIVRNYIIMYSEKMPKKMRHVLGLCKYYMPIFEEIFDRYGLPTELKAMAIIESSLNPTAVSKAGAKGMWQFMYQTAKGYKLHIDSFVDERLDPVKSCIAAAQYLSDAYTLFGDWNLAIASYNCGAGNVRKAIQRAGGSRKFWDIWPYLPEETRSYVPAFVGALYTLEYYNEHGIKPEPMSMPNGVDTLVIKKQLHLKQVSDLTGAPLDELKNLNPQYFHEIVPGHEREYVLRIPYQFSTKFIELEDTIYKHKASEYFDPITIKKVQEIKQDVRIVYQVKSGDNLGKIANKHNVSVDKLRKWNNLKSDNLSIGQKLVLYKGGNGPSTSKSSTSSTPKETKITYTVKKGDVLGKIAEAHGVGVSKIKEWNKLKSDNISVGQKLTIYTKGGPAKSTSSSSSKAKGSSTYTVKSGDTFYSIAKNYPGVSAQNIMDYNGLKSTNLRPGMKIKIPQY